MATWGQLLFQDAASPIIKQLILFHDHAIIILTLITSIVAYAIISLTTRKFRSRTTLEAQQIEAIWTGLPSIILIFLALPSLRLLYLIDELRQPSITIKAIGHQWYWSYEYSDFRWPIQFDSYIIRTDQLNPGDYRLLEVDNRAVFPINTEIRVLVTAADVIHAWTVPALGIKVDAIPGRLNQLGFISSRPGVFYGQCSEICGANHSFIPIAIEIIKPQTFIKWAKNISINI